MRARPCSWAVATWGVGGQVHSEPMLLHPSCSHGILKLKPVPRFPNSSLSAPGAHIPRVVGPLPPSLSPQLPRQRALPSEVDLCMLNLSTCYMARALANLSSRWTWSLNLVWASVSIALQVFYPVSQAKFGDQTKRQPNSEELPKRSDCSGWRADRGARVRLTARHFGLNPRNYERNSQCGRRRNESNPLNSRRAVARNH